jgi:hypothetical protein
MAQVLPAESHHVDAVLDHLAGFDHLGHVRARRRGDLITLESGPEERPIPHTRFRRVSAHRWQIEMPMRGGKWDGSPARGPLLEALEAVIAEFPWMLEERG